MSWKDNKEALLCRGCSEPMAGIRDYKARTLCEGCGGNKTAYNEAVPHPENWQSKQNKDKR